MAAMVDTVLDSRAPGISSLGDRGVDEAFPGPRYGHPLGKPPSRQAGYHSRGCWPAVSPVPGAARGPPCRTRQVILARSDNQARAAGELGCAVIAAPQGCRRPYTPCLFSQPRQASATSRQPESMVRE